MAMVLDVRSVHDEELLTAQIVLRKSMTISFYELIYWTAAHIKATSMKPWGENKSVKG